MATLQSNTRVYGNLTVDGIIIANTGAGFQNMVVLTAGTANTYTFPTPLQVPGAKLKITLVGGGGGGGGTTTTAGMIGGGGGSGGVVISNITVVSGLYNFVYTVGAAGLAGATNAAGSNGSNSSVTYNSTVYTAGGGTGGPTATAATVGGAGGVALNGIINYVGNRGGLSGTYSATSQVDGIGGSTPLGFGQGGRLPVAAAGAVGLVGTGYGAGGSGGKNGSAATARTGGAGTIGIILVEY